MFRVNKGTSRFWSAEALTASDEALGLLLLSVLDSILRPVHGEVHRLNDKYHGLVEEAHIALSNDIHGLAILQDMITFTYENKHQLLRHKDFLYSLELIEKYFTNLRSIYDFMSKVLRLSVEERRIGQIPFDSLNDMIAFSETKRGQECLSKQLVELLKGIKAEFHLIRNMRDFIVHHGKQITLLTDDNGYKLGPFDSTGNLAEFVPGEERKYEALMPYLAERTQCMLSFGDEIGNIIFNEFQNQHGKFPFSYSAIEGECIPSFIRFLALASNPNN